jgi:hypothetical protein
MNKLMRNNLYTGTRISVSPDNVQIKRKTESFLDFLGSIGGLSSSLIGLGAMIAKWPLEMNL